MKDRTREAVFNLLGPQVKGVHAIDLFAGTGALGLEAISRGAARATFAERHFPTARLIERNIAALNLDAQCEVIPGETFRFSRHAEIDDSLPWAIFCSPPYDLYVDQQEEMLELIRLWIDRAPPKATFIVESDERFDMELLPHPSHWDVRRYAPAIVAVLRVDDIRE